MVVVEVPVLVPYPAFKEIPESIVPGSCSQVLVEMIDTGEYIHIEGRYGEAFIKVLALFCGAPICMFQMDEDYRVVAITLQVRCP
jgi:hypothetical protein